VVLQSCVCDGADLAGLLLGKVRVGWRQVCADRSNDGASCVRDGALLVCVLKCGASAGVLDACISNIGVVVDDAVAVMGNLGVGDWASGLGVFGIVVRVVWGKGGRGGASTGQHDSGSMFRSKRLTQRQGRLAERRPWLRCLVGCKDGCGLVSRMRVLVFRG